MQFYGISFMHSYKQCGRWKIVHILPPTRLLIWMHEIACTSLPEDEHWDVRNTQKTQ